MAAAIAGSSSPALASEPPFVPHAIKPARPGATGRDHIAFYHYATKAGWEHGRYKSNRAICGSIPRAYAACYKRYGDIGQGTYLYLTSHSYPYDHLSTYVFYKYHWNPNLEIDKLLDEYYTLFYGPAAEPMRKYWEEVEQQFRKVLSKSMNTPLNRMRSESIASVANLTPRGFTARASTC